jgi:uncharacterized membrane protein YfcA
VNTESFIRQYFAGEKSEAALILLAAVVCLVVAAWLWFSIREPFARGLAGALMLTAALGLGVGGTVYLRSDRQAQELVELQAADPARFASEEGSRMRKVMAGFGQYRLGYAAAVVLALVLVFGLGSGVAQGAAVGLLVLAALGFTIDYFAEERAEIYVEQVAP